MKKKLWTALEEPLIQNAKALAAEQGRPLQSVIEDALREYVLRQKRLTGASVVGRTGPLL